MKSIPISEFRQQCLSLLADLPKDGIVLTRRGKPVAKVLPVVRLCADLIGIAPECEYKDGDDLFTTEIEWDAES